MKIEIWSDFVCPFCYIGKRLLEQALEQFEHRDKVEVFFKSYELNPYAKNDRNLSVYEELSGKYRMSIDETKQMVRNVVKRAESVGLTYNFDLIKQVNTFNAHRIFKYAETKGKGDALTERFFRAHFTEGQFIGDDEVLITLSKEVGLDETEVKQVLESDAFTEEVRKDQQEARQIGVQGVPFFVINRKYAISGAQPLELFVDTLKQVYQEETQTIKLTPVSGDDSLACDDDGCVVPEKK